MNTTIKSVYILFLIILAGIFFRVYNVNFDDLWIDEIATFWISNPEYSINESFKNHRSLEQTPYLFNYLTRIYFKLFGYSDEIFRYISVFFSIASIFSLMILSRTLENNNSYILVTFLISFNIFLISYSQEMRVYSTLFFFNCTSILYFFKYLKNNKNNYLILFFFISFISILLHPFSFIVIVSFVSYLFLLFKKKRIFKKLYIILLIISLFFIMYYYLDALNSLGVPTWIKQPELKFFTNFYSSKFFGSRLVGILHFLILIYLLIIFFSKKNKKDYIIFFLILMVYSYTLPLVYGYLFDPIILARYIIFVLIPIIIILSHIIFDLKSFQKKIIICLLVILTIGNFITEETFKQTYKSRSIYKPEFSKGLKLINKSKNFYYNIKIKKNLLYEEAWKSAVDNYILHISKKNNLNLVNYSKSEGYNGPIWEICIHDLNEKNCYVEGQIIEHLKLNRLELILTK